MRSIDHFDDIVDRIEPDQRIALIGPTRCGKSTVERAIIKHFDNAVIVAPKEEWDWDLQPVSDPEEWKRKIERYSHRAYDLTEFQRELNKIARDDSGDPLVFLPKRIADRRLHRQILDYPFKVGLERGNTFMVADDLYYHAHGTNFESAAPWLFYCVTSGGSRGVGCAYAFQRPVWVPQVALSETEHFITFYLQKPEDRDIVDSYAGRGSARERSPIDWDTLRDNDYSFVYFTKRFVSEPLSIDLELEAA